MSLFLVRSILAVAALCLCSPFAFAGDDPFADEVMFYKQGIGAAPGYTDPLTVVGSPERFTGEGVFPSVVSPFSAPFGPDEIVSLGVGGSLTVKFNTPVADDPNNLYGIDLLIFATASFFDVSYPDGIVGGMFGDDGGIIEVSADGEHWETVRGVIADGPMPTLGFADAGPFQETPGSVLTDFTRPVDPRLTAASFVGLNYAQVVQRYRGSGGGVGVDLAATGLAQISYVRITNPTNAPENIEIDAFSDVSPRIPGDANLDGQVNVNDLLMVINAWGGIVPGGPPSDFNNDGVVNVNDLLIVINHWGS